MSYKRQNLKEKTVNEHNLSLAETEELFNQYEWALDYSNCDIPVYRVNANDDILTVL